MMGKVKDLTDQRYGKLVVLEYAGSNHKWNALWRCRCDCGNEKTVLGYNLKNGSTRSCGCLLKNIVSTHGLSNTRIYHIWEGMNHRCRSQSKTSRKYYLEKGITVCDEWHDFNNFYKWAKENGYSDDLTIDRIDSNKGYSPENCRWATYYQQNNNRKSVPKYYFRGEQKTLSEWSKVLGIRRSVLYNRLYSGMSLEKAFTQPLRKVQRRNNVEEVLEG